ncbi:MAG: hypothetical protein WC269_00115 [Candidatus Gracilibacteria bacterium]|jgi:hypothetical protein
MPTEYISIQEAADLSKKSVQTIRRAIKAKKLSTKKMKTPQGFNYLVEKGALCSFYKLKNVSAFSETSPETDTKDEVRLNRKHSGVTKDDIKEFTIVMERLLNQHADERQNFLRLINTLQEKIFFLENQLNLLKAPERRWYQFWK